MRALNCICWAAQLRGADLIELAELPHFGGAHVGVAGELAVVEAGVLKLARLLDARADVR